MQIRKTGYPRQVAYNHVNSGVCHFVLQSLAAVIVSCSVLM